MVSAGRELALSLSLFAGLALGCSPFAADQREVDAGADDAHVAPDAPDAPDAPTDAAPPRFDCDTSLFCDEFEGNLLLPRDWDGIGGTAASTIELAPGEGQRGSQALVVRFPSGDSEQRSLYKSLPVVVERYRVRFAFAARIVAQGSFQGPRFACSISEGARTDLGIKLSAASVGINYHAPTCTACGPNPAASVAIADGWHTYRVEADVEPGDAGASSYGALRLWVDERLELETDLGVPLSGHSECAFLVGVTYANLSSGTVFFDDAFISIDPI